MSGPSGAHKAPRRLLSATLEQWAAWGKAAAVAGMSWAEWARTVLDRAAERQSGEGAKR